jgi:hypothetical protein
MRVFVLGLFVASLLPAVAGAANITYNVQITSGDNSAVGTITTDGTIGALSASDFISESLTITTNSHSTSLTGLTPNLFGGSDVTATTTGLFFNFDGPSGGFGYANSSVGELCLETGYSCNDGYDLMLQSSGGNIGITEVGNFEFAAVPAATPEPSSLILLGTGALSLAGAGWRRLLPTRRTYSS